MHAGYVYVVSITIRAIYIVIELVKYKEKLKAFSVNNFTLMKIHHSENIVSLRELSYPFIF